MITNNISKEYLKVMKNLNNPITEKYIKMSENIQVIEFYYYKSFNTWREGLEIEMDLAIDTNAKCWSPAPGYQIKKYKERMK